MSSVGQSLVLATSNPGKTKEFQALLGATVQLLSLVDLAPGLSLPPEGIDSYDANALQKALFVGSELGVLSLGDDSGLEVAALGGRPGILSARFANTTDSARQRQEILKLLSGVSDRRAHFVCALCLYNPQSKGIWKFRGEVRGFIAQEERGSFGFGYDSIFIPEGFHETFGELSAEIKNRISHRAGAINVLKRQWPIFLEEPAPFPPRTIDLGSPLKA